jgi:hypothetical protein
LRQEDDEFEDSLGHIARLHQKKRKRERRREEGTEGRRQ